MTIKHPPLTIGRIANAAGVNIETIRYYQKKHLIMQPPKPLGGFRYYPTTVIDRVHFIKRAQQLGFSLMQIKQLLDLGDGHCRDVQKMAIEKLDDIEARLKDLGRIKRLLKELLTQCRQNENQPCCAMIKVLARKS